jgi:hypothetical protein
MRRLAQHEVLGPLLRALVGRRLWVVGDAVLLDRPTALGVKDVEGGRVHRAARPRLPGGGDHVERADGVHALELGRVGHPLLEDAHAVEDPLDACDRLAHRAQLRDVAAHELHPVGQRLARSCHVAHKGHDLVATVGQAPRHGVSHLAGRSGDQDSHRAPD